MQFNSIIFSLFLFFIPTISLGMETNAAQIPTHQKAIPLSLTTQTLVKIVRDNADTDSLPDDLQEVVLFIQIALTHFSCSNSIEEIVRFYNYYLSDESKRKTIINYAIEHGSDESNELLLEYLRCY